MREDYWLFVPSLSYHSWVMCFSLPKYSKRLSFVLMMFSVFFKSRSNWYDLLGLLLEQSDIRFWDSFFSWKISSERLLNSLLNPFSYC